MGIGVFISVVNLNDRFIMAARIDNLQLLATLDYVLQKTPPQTIVENVDSIIKRVRDYVEDVTPCPQLYKSILFLLPHRDVLKKCYAIDFWVGYPSFNYFTTSGITYFVDVINGLRNAHNNGPSKNLSPPYIFDTPMTLDVEFIGITRPSTRDFSDLFLVEFLGIDNNGDVQKYSSWANNLAKADAMINQHPIGTKMKIQCRFRKTKEYKGKITHTINKVKIVQVY